MLSYHNNDTSLIISFSFLDVDLKTIDTHGIFKEGSKCLNQIYSINKFKQMHLDSGLGWKPTLFTPVCMYCSCYKRPDSMKSIIRK